jgi:hypothetical protein
LVIPHLVVVKYATGSACCFSFVSLESPSFFLNFLQTSERNLVLKTYRPIQPVVFILSTKTKTKTSSSSSSSSSSSRRRLCLALLCSEVMYEASCAAACSLQ